MYMYMYMYVCIYQDRVGIGRFKVGSLQGRVGIKILLSRRLRRLWKMGHGLRGRDGLLGGACFTAISFVSLRRASVWVCVCVCVCVLHWWSTRPGGGA